MKPSQLTRMAPGPRKPGEGPPVESSVTVPLVGGSVGYKEIGSVAMHLCNGLHAMIVTCVGMCSVAELLSVQYVRKPTVWRWTAVAL